MAKKLLIILFFLIGTTAFAQLKSVDQLKASPNPFSNQTTIYFQSQLDQPVLVTVRNVIGKTVYNEKLQVKKGQNTFLFKRNDLAAGMYIYAIQTNKEVVSKRFVIK